jgi:small subunit ribosomal protein S16
MSVKIRLTRIGRHKDPFYRIVAADGRFARDGRYIEQIGTYDPVKGLEAATIDEALALKWLNAGAIPSDSIRAMFSKKGIMTKFADSKKKAPVKKAKVAAKKEAVKGAK